MANKDTQMILKQIKFPPELDERVKERLSPRGEFANYSELVRVAVKRLLDSLDRKGAKGS
jgi:Arc/MetJ-type ribon-helix-helix transcriptional regulator